MSNTRCQNECEAWVRDHWLPSQYDARFTERNVRLSSGGHFKFDAVSEDGAIVASISTSRAAMSSGKKGVGKLMKLRSDMLFHTLANSARHIMIFTEPCMLASCEAERARGRVPSHIEFVLVPLPDELAARLSLARDRSSKEVRPSSPTAV